MREYELTTKRPLRDNLPPNQKVTVTEQCGQPIARSGNLRFDALYALANQEAEENAVDTIRDADYAHGAAIEIPVYQTGEKWHFVWTRDLAYALDLGLAFHCPSRAVQSLRFKASRLKASVQKGFEPQIIQDTGSGGSYPVSTDRIVWALGAHQALLHTKPANRPAYLEEIFPILRGTIEQDRVLIFDEAMGLYRGEQSFLDWREQTYPQWTANNVLSIAMSKSLSVNVLYAHVLKITAEYALELGHTEEADKYSSWSRALRSKMNDYFYDSQARLLRTYILSESGECHLPVARYDLLGQCLAILLDLVDEERGHAILDNYPTGPHGPSVVWPQEAAIDIYHNQAVWPFVTAYWVKAGRKLGNAAVVDAGLNSLMELASANLSNMENFDFVSGLAYAESEGRSGPVINSRRQLWSVAGYLSLVHEAVFGFEVSLQGVRVSPFITAWMHDTLFSQSPHLELTGLTYLQTRHDIRVVLPEANTFSSGIAQVTRVLLNGNDVTGQIVSPAFFKTENRWEVTLNAPAKHSVPSTFKLIRKAADADIYAPPQPHWDEKRGAIVPKHGRLCLHFEQSGDTQVIDIYREGVCCAKDIRSDFWIDVDSSDYERHVRVYHLIARDIRSGLCSHFSRGRRYWSDGQELVIPASQMSALGGDLDEHGPLKNWGQPQDEIHIDGLQRSISGRYCIQFSFSNGTGLINTGITCAIKHLEVSDLSNGKVIGHTYLIMPQSGSWNQYELSNSLMVELDHTRRYRLRLFEDEFCRNMSYFANNEQYSARAGGGHDSYNYVNIASARLSLVHT